MLNIRRPFKLLNLSIETSKCRSHSTRLSHNVQPSSKVSEEERLIFENTQLQFQIHQKEQELKMFKIKQNQCQPTIGLNVDTTQSKQNIKKLQFYIKQLELESFQKGKIIEDMKKQMSFTKLQELQIEAISYQQESQRLQKHITKLSKLLNYKSNGIDLFEIHESLSQQNQNLEKAHNIQLSVIEQLQNQQQMQQLRIEQLELENKNLQRENQKVLQLLNQNKTPNQNKLTNRNQFMQEEIEINKLQAKISQLQNLMTKYKNKKEKYIQQLLSIIMDKDEQIQAYEKQQKIIKEVSKNDQQILDQKYQQSIIHIKSEYSIVDDLSFDFPPPQLNLIKQMSIRKKLNFQEQQKSQLQEDASQIDEEQSSKNLDSNDIVQNEYKTIRLNKVNFYEVELIGKKLKFELQLKMIPISYVDQIFDVDNDEFEEVTVEEIILILSEEPFMLVEEKQRLLVARYLIEDNSQDYVMHNLKNSNSIAIIKSVLKQLLGKYQLFTKQEKLNIEQQLKTTFQKVKFKILDHLQQSSIKKKNHQVNECTADDFEAILTTLEISLLPRQLEYLYFINYSLCKKVENFCYNELLQYFCNVETQ